MSVVQRPAGGRLDRLVDEHRARIERSLPERLDRIARGGDQRTAELIARREHVGRKARAGDAGAAAELARVRTRSAASPPTSTAACGR